MIKINEIFFSIQGESSYTGWPTVFVRTSGCNLRCTYCDTKYAYYEGEKQTIEEVVQRVKNFPAKYVCITGGEPMLQKEVLPLMTALCDLTYHVSLETSGSLSCRNVDSRVKKIIDIKTPDSGADGSFILENLETATTGDEFKFVICSRDDFLWAEDFSRKYLFSKSYMTWYSPSFGAVKEKDLAQWILDAGSDARMQIQIHKYIWTPETRGV